MAGMFDKTFAITSAAMLALTAPITLAADEWSMDFAAAKKIAEESGKDLFIEFTGSDWCPPCQMLNREVFSKEAFVTAAAEHFVLVKLDFPNDTSGLTEEIQTQNAELAEKYGIEAFPSVILTDAQGRPYGATGFREGGVEPYLEHLISLRENRTKRDAAFEAASAAEGVEKAKGLFDALNALDIEFSTIERFYGEEIDAIKANDPDDETGLVQQAEKQKRMAKFQEDINALAQTGDFDGILPVIDEMLKGEGFTPQETQEITLTRAMVFAQLGRFDEAIAVVEDAAEIAPDSEIAPHLEGFKAQLVQARDAMDAEGDQEEEP